VSPVREAREPHGPRSFKPRQSKEAASVRWARDGPEGEEDVHRGREPWMCSKWRNPKGRTQNQRKSPGRAAKSNPGEVGDEPGLDSFFSQLWVAPQPRRIRVSPHCLHPNRSCRDPGARQQAGEKSRSPVRERLVLESRLQREGCAQVIWNRGEKSYLQALIRSMAGRGGRGRGRGRGGRFEEDQWGNPPGWWNQGFHLGAFPHPQFSAALWILS
jgi:hypothetical protein